MTDGLVEAGYPRGAITTAPTELDAVRAALGWAEPGDLLVLGIHQDRRGVMALLDALRASGWAAGRPLPSAASAVQ